MTDLNNMVDTLMRDVEWQRIPIVMNDVARRQLLSSCLQGGIEALFIVTGRAGAYSENMYERDSYDVLISMPTDLLIDEKKFAMLTAKIEFFRKVQMDVNNIVGYTTDALTVTNADKPYMNLAATIEGLEKERRVVYYKMTRYTMM